jgi:hypothetical protein
MLLGGPSAALCSEDTIDSNGVGSGGAGGNTGVGLRNLKNNASSIIAASKSNNQ